MIVVLSLDLDRVMSVSIDQGMSVYIYHLKPDDIGVELFPSEA